MCGDFENCELDNEKMSKTNDIKCKSVTYKSENCLKMLSN